MFHLLITVSILVWLMSSIVLATVFGAMFAPDKDRIVGRSIISFLLIINIFNVENIYTVETTYKISFSNILS